MRTTLTLDDDVSRLVEDAVRSDRRTMKDVVNDALRRALGTADGVSAHVVPVHRSGVRGGIDVARLNHLVDELADDELTSS